MCILVILGKSALVQRTRCHLLCQSPLYNVQFSYLFPYLIILVLQILTLVLQVALHVRHIIIAKFIGHPPSRLYHCLHAPQLRSHHRDLLPQKVLFLLQSVIFSLEFDDFVLLVGSGDRVALSLPVVASIVSWNA